MVLHNGTILLCGGSNNQKKCLQLEHGTWKEHSTLKAERMHHSAVTTKTATFLFGGTNSPFTYEYLPKDSNTWLKGKTKMPVGFSWGLAIAVKSDSEIWLIGGHHLWRRRIISFNVKDHTFQELLSKLKVTRNGFRCALIPNTNKVMITGGHSDSDGYLDSTEIIATDDGTVTMASPMNSARAWHGMGVVTINGEERLVVVGGNNEEDSLESVELYNTQTEKWELADIKLNEAKSCFNFLGVEFIDVIENCII